MDLCSTRNSTLVMIHSSTELHLLQPFIRRISDRNHFWIGLKRNKLNTFEWEDGTKLDYSKWAAYEPKNDSKFACVRLWSISMGWATDGCDKSYPFLCSIEKYMQEKSMRDSNDPQVKSVNTIIISGVLIIIIVAIIVIYIFKNNNNYCTKTNEELLNTHLCDMNIRYSPVEDNQIVEY